MQQSTWFSPSIYEIMHKKYKASALSAFYLPDTIIFEHSVIKNWYFSSYESVAILKKNEPNQDETQLIIERFTANIYPLSVCAVVVFIDINKYSKVVYKVQYLAPPQLVNLLLNYKKMDLTCVLERIITKVPEIADASEEGSLAQEPNMNSLIFEQAAEEVIYQREVSEQSHENETKMYHNDISKELKYHLINVIWRPDGISLMGRTSTTYPDEYEFNPNYRYSTFFSDDKSDKFGLSESNTELINKEFEALSVHVERVTGKQLTYIDCYVQLLEMSKSRYVVANQEPVFFFAESLELNREENDLIFSNEVHFDIRSGFKQPIFLDYRLCKEVVEALTQKELIRADDEVYKLIYKIALQSQNVYQLVRNNEYELVNVLSTDLFCQYKDKNERANEALSAVIQNIAISNEYNLLLKELELNNRVKEKCCRCEQFNASFKIPLKFILSEPIYYFEKKLPFIKSEFRNLQLEDCYAAISAVVFNDDSYLEFKDNMRMVLEQETDIEVDDMDIEEEYELICQEDTAFLKLLMNEQLCNNLQATKKFFAKINKIKQAKNDLPIDELKQFYDINGVELDSLAPNELLRKAGIVKTKMSAQSFMQRCNDRNWLRNQFDVCNKCFNDIVGKLRDLWGQVE